jgi:hypothetical protein
MGIHKGAWVNEAGGTGPTCVRSGKLYTFADSSDVFVQFKAYNEMTPMVPGHKYVIGAWDTGTCYDMTFRSVTETPGDPLMGAFELGLKVAKFTR